MVLFTVRLGRGKIVSLASEKHVTVLRELYQGCPFFFFCLVVKHIFLVSCFGDSQTASPVFVFAPGLRSEYRESVTARPISRSAGVRWTPKKSLPQLSHEHERVEGPDEKVSPQNKIRTTAQPHLPILFPFLGPCS